MAQSSAFRESVRPATARVTEEPCAEGLSERQRRMERRVTEASQAGRRRTLCASLSERTNCTQRGEHTRTTASRHLTRRGTGSVCRQRIPQRRRQQMNAHTQSRSRYGGSSAAWRKDAHAWQQRVTA